MTTKTKLRERKTLIRALFMLAILAYLLVISMSSCTKSGYKPDQDQVSCKTFYDIREHWEDSAKSYMFTDTVEVNTHLICNQDKITKTESIIESNPPHWFKVCYPNTNEISHWELRYMVLN